MTDPVVNKVAQQVADQAAQSSASTPAEHKVDVVDQQRFEQALEGVDGPEAPKSAQQVEATSETAKAEAAETAEKTMGDAMLEGLQNLKSSYDQTVSKVETTLIDTDGQELTVQEMMKLQMELMQIGMQQDLTTKVADKTSQGVQTLFRNQ